LESITLPTTILSDARVNVSIPNLTMPMTVLRNKSRNNLTNWMSWSESELRQAALIH
jgi:hypothetical protein